MAVETALVRHRRGARIAVLPLPSKAFSPAVYHYMIEVPRLYRRIDWAAWLPAPRWEILVESPLFVVLIGEWLVVDGGSMRKDRRTPWILAVLAVGHPRFQARSPMPQSTAGGINCMLPAMLGTMAFSALRLPGTLLAWLRNGARRLVPGPRARSGPSRSASCATLNGLPARLSPAVPGIPIAALGAAASTTGSVEAVGRGCQARSCARRTRRSRSWPSNTQGRGALHRTGLPTSEDGAMGLAGRSRKAWIERDPRGRFRRRVTCGMTRADYFGTIGLRRSPGRKGAEELVGFVPADELLAECFGPLSDLAAREASGDRRRVSRTAWNAADDSSRNRRPED